MASIQKRKNKNGTSHWRAVVRIKGLPTVCSHWDRKQEVEDWAQGVERQINPSSVFSLGSLANSSTTS